MLELPILTNQKLKFKLLIIIALIIIDVVLMFLFRTSFLIFISATFLLLYLFMLLGKNEKHIEKGTLILKYDEIEIILDDRKLIIDPSKFQFTPIHYSGYAGKNVFINTRKYSGTDNRIIYYELSKKYNFLISG